MNKANKGQNKYNIDNFDAVSRIQPEATIFASQPDDNYLFSYEIRDESPYFIAHRFLDSACEIYDVLVDQDGGTKIIELTK